MTEFMRLELRKNRLLAWGLGAAFLASLPLAALGTRLGGHPVADVLNAALLFWTLGGLPLFGVLIGASSGVGLRSEPNESAEAVLPLSPLHRTSGALVAGALRLAALAALVLAVAWLISPAWRSILFEPARHIIFTDRPPAPPFVRPLFWSLPFSLGYLLLLSFICAYAMRQGVVGGAFGFLLAACTAACLALGWQLEEEHFRTLRFTPIGIAVMAVALAGAVAALRWTAPWVGRDARLGLRGAALTVLGLAAGALASAAAFQLSVQTIRRSTQFIDLGYMPFTSQTLSPHDTMMARPTDRGTTLRTIDDDIFWVTQEGAVTRLLHGEPKDLWAILGYTWTDVESMVWDSDGDLWLMRLPHRWEGGRQELWRGRPESELTLHARLQSGDGGRLVQIGGEVGLSKSESVDFSMTRSREYWATLPLKDGKPRWQEIGDLEAFAAKRLLEQGLAGRLDASRKLLSRRTPGGGSVTCRFPAAASESPGIVLPHAVGPKGPVFFMRIIPDGDGVPFTAACMPDGQVRTGWAGKARYLHAMDRTPQGAVWTWFNLGRLGIAEPDGTFHGLLDMRPAFRDILMLPGTEGYLPKLVHNEGTTLWLLAHQRWLVKVDGSAGTVLARWELPPDPVPDDIYHPVLHPVEGGVFVHDGRALHLVDWEGRRRRIRVP